MQHRRRKLDRTGHKQIDNEHNELIYMLDQLGKIISIRTEDKTIVKLFNNLIKSAELHIKNENQLMIDSKYPGIEKHVKQHQAILTELQNLKNELEYQ